MYAQKKKVVKKHARNALSWLFSLALVSTMMPVNALAAAAADDESTAIEQEAPVSTSSAAAENLAGGVAPNKIV